ncbi:translation machinery-associated protein 16 [Denticeps clupeoides]|uniref:Translation machinery-associated protein 16 n=1 Tax=Denticeps clupeoides TaxID=299321 RepID=A0AAY4DN75_9TELE|nr:translation machinery-associated protein 16 [Denticeps clupeoides]
MFLRFHVRERRDRMPKAAKGKAPAEKKVVHPYSRKAGYLVRAAARQDRKERQRNEKAQRLNLIGEQLMWFQSHLDPDKAEYSRQDACDLIERYLHRFDGELEQIELVNSIKGRQGRVHGSREAVIRQSVERERALYEGVGFEIPDIVNTKHLKTFRTWSGDLKKLPNIKMRRVSSKGTKSSQSSAQRTPSQQEEESIEEEETEEEADCQDD